MVQGEAAHVAEVQDGVRREIVGRPRRTRHHVLRPPKSGVFPRERDIDLRNGRKEICLRAPNSAFFRELPIFQFADSSRFSNSTHYRVEFHRIR